MQKFFISVKKDKADRVIKALNEFCDLNAVYINDSIQLNDDDIDKFLNNLKILEISKFFSLSNQADDLDKEFKSNAAKLLREYKKKPDKPIPIHDRYGITSEIYKAQLDFFFEDITDSNKYIIENLVPFVKEKIKCTHALVLFVYANEFQKIISCIKILYYFKNYSEQDARKLIQERCVLEGVLPLSNNAINYYQSLMVASPCIFAIPFYQLASAIYFFDKKTRIYPEEGASGLLKIISINHTPLTSSNAPIEKLFESITGISIRHYLYVVADGINNLFKEITDFRNYTESGKYINIADIIIMYCAINLYFTDLLTIQRESSIYVKTRFSFSLMDKLTNMRLRHTSKSSREEALEFNTLLSINMRDKLISYIRYNVKPRNRNLSERMSNFVQFVYDDIYEKCNENIGASNLSVGEYLRKIRNTNHGTYFLRKGFERDYFDKKMELPSTFVYLPMILSWGLILNPKEMLCFDQN